MKRFSLAAFAITIFVCSVLFAGVPLNKKHKDLKGKDGAKVNCAYCHNADKANNPKKKGTDLAKLKKGPYCAIKGCHPGVDKKK